MPLLWWRKNRRPAEQDPRPPLADGARTVDGAPPPAYWLGLSALKPRNDRPQTW